MEPAELKVRVAEGVRLHVRRFPGSSARPPFLLVHGLSSNARLWDGVAARLAAAGYTAYAVDLRSHGESDRPESGYDTATAVDDLAALAAKLDLPPAIVVGQSWGGNVAVEFAAQHPDRTRGLALVDGGWIDLSDRFSSWEECARVLRPPDVDGMREVDLAAHIRREHSGWDEWAVRATLANFHVDADGHLSRRLPVAQHMSILRSMWDEVPSRHYPDVRAPTLLLPALPRDGEEAAARGAKISRAAAALGGATVHAYAGSDHDIHAHRPAELAADLLELAGRLDSGVPT